MSIDRLLLLHTAALAVMGALILGLGQNNATMPLALVFAAVIATSLGDRVRWLKLNRVLANVAALGAVAWSLRDFLSRGGEGQLLAIADMLVYLQIVLLFQEKTARVYWQLLVLSLLQVVVAAALNLGPQFGLLLAMYITVALSTLILLCIERECHAPEPAANARTAPPGPWHKFFAAPSVVAAGHLRQQAILLQSPRLVLVHVGLVALATFAFTVVFFFSTPRQTENMWLGPRSRLQSKTGFAPEVHLERNGKVQQSNALVMRVTLTRLIDKRPYMMLGEPYFQGMVLTEYRNDGRRSRWLPKRTQRAQSTSSSRHIVLPASNTLLIRQDYVVESPNSPAMFAILPYHKLTETPADLRFLRPAQRLVRVPDEDFFPQREYRYSVGTMGLRDGRHLRVNPHPNPVTTWNDAMLLHEEIGRLSQFDAAQFPHVQRVAKKVIADVQLESGSTLEKMLALQTHFLAEGNYFYTLDLNFPHNDSLDPIEDFVANHRRGHCEYFASALVLMLRSQGIPAQMVIGYKGGEFNSLGQYYQVREKHTHAWVEAYLPPDEVPADELGCTPSPGGGWYRLDPTPAQLVALDASTGPGFFSKLGEATDYLDLMWRDYVLGLNAVRQRDKLYDPLSARTTTPLPKWLDPNRFQSQTSKLAQRLGLKQVKPDSRTRFWSFWTIVGVVTAVGGLGVLLRGVWWLTRRFLPKRTRRSNDRLANYSSPPAFYRRLEQILARASLPRAAGQTARELAAAAELRLQSIPEMPEAKLLPAGVVKAYYRVRFGGATLDNQETAAIEQALAKLSVVMGKQQL